MEILDSLLSQWQKESCGILPAEPEDAVHATFRELGSAATRDVVALYSYLGGMQMFCDSYWRLWSLEEVAAQRSVERGVLFSDYFISCWNYRLVPISDDCSAVYVDFGEPGESQLVATTLEEFFIRYAHDRESLVNPTALPQLPQVHKDSSWSRLKKFFQ